MGPVYSQKKDLAMVPLDDKKENCCGCGACFCICPHEAIQMKTDREGFLYPDISPEKCVQCGLCRLACPVITPERLPKNSATPKVLAAWNLDPEIRRQSSSGGVFTVLAEETLARGGVVFGAGFDKQWILRHTAAKNREEIAQFRGSKYLQSDTGDVFYQIKEFLQQKKWVLFTGTPCKVAGLNAYLGEPYETLLTCDFVCHGVPSPKVFYKYIYSLADKDHIKFINFRNKKYGWKRFSMHILLEDKEYYTDLNKDIFLKAFLKDICLRPSCHKCSFASLQRTSDITLGDFWGIGNSRPDLDDDQGTSLILINSGQGKEFFDTCNERLFSAEMDLKTAIQGNPCLVKSVSAHPSREEFFRDLDRETFPRLIKTYLPPPTLMQKIRECISRIIRKLRKLFFGSIKFS